MTATAESPRPRRRVLPTVALAAAALRLLYFAEHSRSAFFTIPILDSRHFDRFARALAEGTIPEALATGFRATLYPILLAPLYRIAGDLGIVLAQIAQHAVGVGTAVVVAALARQLFKSDRAALFAGLAYAAAPVPLFFEGELLVESLFVASFALLLLLGALARRATLDRQTVVHALATGALIAFAAQLRPNAWLFLAALPWLAPAARRMRWSGLALASFAAPTLLFAAAQKPLTGGLQLLPAAGGVNLYLGNRRGADGLVPRQEFAVSHAEEYRDSVEAFAVASLAREGRSPGDSSTKKLRRFWLARTWGEVAADPIGRLALLGRKALVVCWNGEVPNNRDFAFVAGEESRLLHWLPARFGLLLTLAAVGLATAPRTPALRWLLALALLHALGVVVFFVADRFRLPLYAPCAVLAGGGAAGLIDAARSRDTWRLRRFAAFATGAALLSFIDWTGARHDLPGAERDLYFRSIARSETGDAAGALADARSAATLDPRDPYLHLQIATAALTLDRLEEADDALTRAGRLAPSEPRILNARGVLHERRDEPAAAYGAYRAALAIAPTFAPALSNAAWWELLHGRAEEARRHLAALPRSAIEDPRVLLARSELARRDGRLQESRRLHSAALELAPETVEALEQELARAAGEKEVDD